MKCDFSTIDLHTLSCDAGFYRIIPSEVSRPENESDIKTIFARARASGVGVTFRAAGTSLSGQAIGPGIIADISRGWKEFEIFDNDGYISIAPGVICGYANKMLRKTGRKLGFDPASIDACMIGGALSNNSSGMTSGVERNPFNTLKSMRFILPSGTVVDRARPDADEKFRRDEPGIYDALLKLRSEIGENESIRSRIIDSYKMKNTIGYSMNAFTEFDKPVDIMSHLMIGSEGTLGFISRAEIRTLPLLDRKLTALLIFDNMYSACSALPAIRGAGAAAIEIMDDICIDAGKDRPGVPPEMRSVPPGSAALLCEFEFDSPDYIHSKEAEFNKLCSGFSLIFKPYFAADESGRNALWEMRKAVLPSLGKKRPPGSIFIIEDICVPVDKLGRAADTLKELFKKYDYKNAGIYGHGMDGNLHFMISADFSDKAEVLRFGKFTDDLASFITEETGGSLKAEHGTGRAMAPYIEKQWGSDIYEMMKEIKRAVDPCGIMNPGVLINSDKRIHLSNLKDYPLIDKEADACIECGFCESVCPSRNLSLTPRKRIVALREIERINKPHPRRVKLIDEYDYPGMDTCAADGLCETRCPMQINTGAAMKNLRYAANSDKSVKIAEYAVTHFAAVQNIVRFGIYAAKTAERIIGHKNINRIIDNANERIKGVRIPVWNTNIGSPERMLRRAHSIADAVYFPCCTTRMMGGGESGLARTMTDVCSRLGSELWIPGEIDGHCCGMAFDSKGYYDSSRKIANRTIESLWEWSDQGRLPVVFDSSSCAYFIKNAGKYIYDINREKYKLLNLYDSIEYIWQMLPYPGEYKKIEGKVALHPNCSVRKMGLGGKFKDIAEYFAKDVYIPDNIDCCGFAGDRGLLFPELNISAAAAESAEIANVNPDRCYSSNLPCEAGMKTASGYEFKSYVFLLHEALNL